VRLRSPIDDGVVAGGGRERGLVPQHAQKRGPSREIRPEQSAEDVRAAQRLQRRELGGEPCDLQLEHSLRPNEILEPVLAEVAQADALEIEILDDSRGRGREEDLPAVTGGADPSRAIHADPNVPALAQMWLSGVESDADAQRLLEPGDRPLGRQSRTDGVACSLKNDEEPVAGRVDLVATVVRESLPQNASMLRA
jgi:hypothetical protein